MYPLNMTNAQLGGYALANDAAAIEYDKRWGLERLKALLPKD